MGGGGGGGESESNEEERRCLMFPLYCRLLKRSN